MEYDLQNQYQRYNRLVTEIQYRQRAKDEAAEKAQKILSTISEADIKTVSQRLPAIEAITGITVEQLKDDTSGAADMIASITGSLFKLLDETLTRCEEQL